MTPAATTSSSVVRHTYRTLARLVSRMPDQQNAWNELRTSFRRELSADETLDDRLRKAGERVAFLRMITPKERASGKGGRWVYKDGKRVEGGQEGSAVQGQRVISNFDGSNLDPCSVKRHQYGLKRAGFANNLHAKGIF